MSAERKWMRTLIQVPREVQMRVVRRFVVLAIVVGVVVKVLRTLGIVGGGECTPACSCSQGALDCECAHATCLAPSAA